VSTTKEIFSKNYDGESLYDLSRDVHEAFDPRFNDKADGIPVDEYGFQKGSFKVTITWEADESDGQA